MDILGAPHRGIRFLQHADAPWLDDELMDFVHDVADRMVLREPVGQTVSFPSGDLMSDHKYFPDAGISPERNTFSQSLEQVLLFCKFPYKEYRENLHTTFAVKQTVLTPSKSLTTSP